MKTKITALLLAVAINGGVAAATANRLEEALKKALPLVESGQVAEAMRIVRNIGGCKMAEDAIPVRTLFKGAEAQGIRAALRLLEDGRLEMADNLTRSMSGCRSRMLDLAMRSEERDVRSPAGPIEFLMVDSSCDYCQSQWDSCVERVEHFYEDQIEYCSNANCSPSYENWLDAWYQNSLDQCSIDYYGCWLQNCDD